MFEGRPNAPCQNCKDRRYSCHSRCKKYQDFSDEEENYRNLVRKQISESYNQKEDIKRRWRLRYDR